MKNSVALFALLNLISFGALAAPSTTTLKIKCENSHATSYNINIDVTDRAGDFTVGRATLSSTLNGSTMLLNGSDTNTASAYNCGAERNKRNVITQIDCVKNYGFAGSNMTFAQLKRQANGLYNFNVQDSFSIDATKPDIEPMIVNAKNLRCAIVK